MNIDLTAENNLESAITASQETVRRFLLDHPEFITKDAELMRALIDAPENAAPEAPTKGRRKVVNLQTVLIDKLETRLGALETAHRDLISAAYENMTGMSQIHRAVLMVLEASTFEGFLEVAAIEIARELNVDVGRFLVETEADLFGRGEGATGDDDDPIVAVEAGNIAELMALDPEDERDPNAAVLLRNDIRGAPLIYGNAADRVRSEALIKLNFGSGNRPGLLVFGAEDPERFHAEQADDLLAFLGGVIERVMQGWLLAARE